MLFKFRIQKRVVLCKTFKNREKVRENVRCYTKAKEVLYYEKTIDCCINIDSYFS